MPPHLPEHQIRRIALQGSRAAGDPHPALIQRAEGTRDEANWMASGDRVFDTSWAYLVAIRGQFDAPGSYSVERPNAEAQGFSVLVLVLDAKTGRVEDCGMTNHYPALAQLGLGHPRLRPPATRAPRPPRHPLR